MNIDNVKKNSENSENPENTDHFICNAVQSPIDRRDWIYATNASGTIPNVVDYRDLLQPIRNQGRHGSCFAMSSCCMKELQERKDYNFQDYFSPKFFYAQRINLVDEHKYNDEGMYGRDVMRILQKIGVCYEKTCPYVNVEEKTDWTPFLEEAKQHVISHYARVSTVEGLCQAIHKHGVCLITVPVYNKTTNSIWKKLTPDAKLQGGHAMAVVGYDKERKYFIIRNSWGEKWCDKGYCLFPFADWGMKWEVWTTVDDDTEIEKWEDPKTCPPCVIA